MIIIIIIFINTNYAKKIVKTQVQTYLQKKTTAIFSIGELDYKFPVSIEIKNFFIADFHNDTLFYGDRLAVDIDMIKLFWSNIYINKIELQNIKANITRTAIDSNYNFQFLIDAFTSKTPSASIDTTATKIE